MFHLRSHIIRFFRSPKYILSVLLGVSVGYNGILAAISSDTGVADQLSMYVGQEFSRLQTFQDKRNFLTSVSGALDNFETVLSVVKEEVYTLARENHISFRARTDGSTSPSSSLSAQLTFTPTPLGDTIQRMNISITGGGEGLKYCLVRVNDTMGGSPAGSSSVPLSSVSCSPFEDVLSAGQLQWKYIPDNGGTYTLDQDVTFKGYPSGTYQIRLRKTTGEEASFTVVGTRNSSGNDTSSETHTVNGKYRAPFVEPTDKGSWTYDVLLPDPYTAFIPLSGGQTSIYNMHKDPKTGMGGRSLPSYLEQVNKGSTTRLKLLVPPGVSVVNWDIEAPNNLANFGSCDMGGSTCKDDGNIFTPAYPFGYRPGLFGNKPISEMSAASIPHMVYVTIKADFADFDVLKLSVTYTIKDPTLYENWRKERRWAGGSGDCDGMGNVYATGDNCDQIPTRATYEADGVKYGYTSGGVGGGNGSVNGNGNKNNGEQSTTPPSETHTVNGKYRAPFVETFRGNWTYDELLPSPYAPFRESRPNQIALNKIYQRVDLPSSWATVGIGDTVRLKVLVPPGVTFATWFTEAASNVAIYGVCNNASANPTCVELPTNYPTIYPFEFNIYPSDVAKDIPINVTEPKILYITIKTTVIDLYLGTITLSYTLSDNNLYNNWRKERRWAGGSGDCDGMGNVYATGDNCDQIPTRATYEADGVKYGYTLH